MSGKFGEPVCFDRDAWLRGDRDFLGVHDTDGYLVPAADVDEDVIYQRVEKTYNALAGYRPEKLAALVEACETKNDISNIESLQRFSMDVKQALAAFRDDDEH